MNWVADCFNAELQLGSRLYVRPELWSEGMAPPYLPAVGDSFSVQIPNNSRLSGTVIASDRDQIDVKFSKGPTHTIVRTPPASAKTPPSVPRIPYEEWHVAQ